MSLVAVPNVSSGSKGYVLAELVPAVEAAGARVLDVHSDAAHDRSVLTVGGETEPLTESMVSLAQACRALSLIEQRGVHPRLGVLDVCPFVPLPGTPMRTAVSAARTAGELIANRARIPVYLYGEAALRPETRELPSLRRGGLDALRRRAAGGLSPDFGDPEIAERWGVVCVGARDVLIAFNVWLRCPQTVAREIASRVRESGGGPTGVRALGLALRPPDISQVAMNLVDPTESGIEEAFQAVQQQAGARDVAVICTELVGLVPERFLPAPDAQATRLLKQPGRTLEEALAEAGLS